MDFNDLPPPTLIFNSDGQIVEIVMEGAISDYQCPECGSQLCWLDMLEEWECPNCSDYE